MSRPPVAPKIYHITHVDNLPQILATGGLWSDAQMLQQSGAVTTIGMSRIKRRRLDEIEVYCHLGTMVGDYYYSDTYPVLRCQDEYVRGLPNYHWRAGAQYERQSVAVVLCAVLLLSALDHALHDLLPQQP